jgi:hypothetical protein
MEEAMAQMAADVFAEMARDTPELDSRPQLEGQPLYPHVQVERELLRGQPAPPAPPARSAPWRAQPWAREHATQAALVATVVLGSLARLRRGRRRGRHSG